MTAGETSRTKMRHWECDTDMGARASARERGAVTAGEKSKNEGEELGVQYGC